MIDSYLHKNVTGKNQSELISYGEYEIEVVFPNLQSLWAWSTLKKKVTEVWNLQKKRK